MYINLRPLNTKTILTATLISLFFFSSVTHTEPVTENEVEDLNLVISQITGGLPNTLVIMDLSGSMGLNSGRSQIGKWSTITLEDCVNFHGTSSDGRRVESQHCAESTANMNVCGTLHCGGEGTCQSESEYVGFLGCILENQGITVPEGSTSTQIRTLFTDNLVTPPSSPVDVCIFNKYCGNNNNTCGETLANCNSDDERARSAAAIESAVNLSFCSSPVDNNCTGPTGNAIPCCADGLPGCNESDEWERFRTCMRDTENNLANFNPTPPGNKPNENCTFNGETIGCVNAPTFGSNRMDITLAVMFDFLDFDDSLKVDQCDDIDGLLTGEVNAPISCQDYMNTPFRYIQEIVRGQYDNDFNARPGDDRNLPKTSGDERLLLQLTQGDAENFPVRLKPLTYSGRGNGNACNSSFDTWDNSRNDNLKGFLEPTESSLRDFWRFIRRERPDGGTPLAKILGLDDNPNTTSNSSTSTVLDALRAFQPELNSDPSVQCRPEFVIVITDGEDTCSPSQTTTNQNRRNSIQAVSNLRTYFSRNPITPSSNPAVSEAFKKEIIVFVIGLGIPEDFKEARRTLNAMALVGGTHTTGIIEHCPPHAPNCNSKIGSVNIFDESILPEVSSLDPLRNLAIGPGLSNNPNDVHLDCGNATSDCDLGSVNLFANSFFDNSTPDGFPAGEELRDFAFFPRNADELIVALNDIVSNINATAIAGVSPGAPQSSGSVALKDRIALALLRPITNQRLWQGRLAMYGFVDDPENVGNKLVVRRPDGTNLTTLSTNALINNFLIFDNDNGTLVPDKAQKFHWEAGKILAERDISSAGNPRNVLTVDVDFSDSNTFDITSSSPESESIIYKGELLPLDSNEITFETFGISDNDVFAFSQNPPDTCDDSTDIADCSSDCSVLTDSPPANIMDSNAADCRNCIKNCLKSQIVDFMSGNTEILPESDPMGSPQIAGEQAGISESIGIDCPNEDEDEDGNTSLGSFDKCSVRLGDIFHSDPKLVGPPSPLFFDVGFQKYAQSFRDRSASIYVGANDGGLHSFHAGEICDPQDTGDPDCNGNINPFTGAEESIPFTNAGTGWEMFFYIPPTFQPDSTANSIRDPHTHFENTFPTLDTTPDYRQGDLKTFVLDNTVQRAFFDGSVTIFDAWFDSYKNGIKQDSSVCADNSTGGLDSTTINTPDGIIDKCGREWHTILTSGYRNGGGGITALNVTNAHCDATGDGLGASCESVGKFSSTDSSTFDDVDAPTYPEHLWTIFDRDFGNTWSSTVPGRVRMKTSKNGQEFFVDRWLLFFGGGLNPENSDPTGNTITDIDNINGNAFYAVDAATGHIVYKFHPTRPIPSSISTVPSGAAENIGNTMLCDMAATPTVVDLNSDGYVDVAYSGDSCGRLWRFDVSLPIEDLDANVTETGINDTAEIEATLWNASIAFCANSESECGDEDTPLIPDENVEPIFFAPSVVFDDIGQRHIIFVTGDRRDPSTIGDINDNNTPNDFSDDYINNGTIKNGRLYNFIDDFIPGYLAAGETGVPIDDIEGMKTLDYFDSQQFIDLVPDGTTVGTNEQFTIENEGNIQNGEFVVNLPDNVDTSLFGGEKGIGTPVVIQRALIFTSFAPDVNLTTSNPCESPAGKGRVFALDFITGEPALGRIPGAENLIIGRSGSVAGISVAEGIPNPAKLTFGAQGSVLMAISFAGGPSTGGAAFLVWELPPFPSRTQTLFWEEII